MKSRFFSSKRRLGDPREDSALVIVNNYKRSKLRRILNENPMKIDPNQTPLCAICLDDCLNQCSPSGCKHTFCFLCISEWGKLSPICPLCKIEFDNVSDPCGVVLGSFEKKNHDEDGDFVSRRDDYGDEGSGDEDALNLLQLQDRSHGYQLDGFVVDDDFVEFDEF
jgi:hypothetical protein